MAEPKRIKDLIDQEEQTEVIRVSRDVRPAHYLFQIKNFSSLLSAKIEKYESTDFEVSGYQWKLRVYPGGNKKVNENKHISLYLVLSESNEFTSHQEVNVYLKLFLYNQILDNYMTVQDAKWRKRRFCGMKTEWGFDQLVPLDVFNDASNGYLIDDCCVFGAEVFVVKPTSKGECASVVKDLSNDTYTWNVQNFAELRQLSPVFVIGGYKWTLEVYPSGDSKEKRLSVFLRLGEALNSGRTLSVQFTLRVKYQINGKNYEKSSRDQISQFSASTSSLGYSNFIPLAKLNDASKGRLTNGEITVEVQISFITEVEEFPS